MKLADLPTPCLVLDRQILARNIDRMAQAVGRLGVPLRPHMKTAKSIDVARMVLANKAAPTAGITVSTLAEAEYFSAHGITDILYAVGITLRGYCPGRRRWLRGLRPRPRCRRAFRRNRSRSGR